MFFLLQFLLVDFVGHKCKQCDYASYQASDLRRHLKAHSGEKSNTANVILYSPRKSHLRTHYKTHSGDKSIKCNQCIFAGKQFEDSFENPQWKKFKQMQPV